MAGQSERPLIHLDTHVVCWLYDGAVEKLSTAAQAAIRGGRLAVSPLIELEITYLHEIGRFRDEATTVLGVLAGHLGVHVSQTPYAQIVAHAVAITWTRDAFDRLIVAHAAADRAQLVTRDSLIRAHFPGAIW